MSIFKPGEATPQPLATSLAALTSRFARNERGSVAMIFGLMVVPCVMLVGFAVDYGRVITVRTQVQGMADAAALAGARAAQVSDETTLSQIATEATTAAQNHLDGLKSRVSQSASVAGVATTSAAVTDVTVSATAWVKTPFMSPAQLVMKNTSAPNGATGDCAASAFNCVRLDIRSTAQIKIGGGNSNQSLEVAMMLDVTGSMSGQKLTDLKVAAKDLIDIVVWRDQSVVTSRVALVPFAEAVNVGTSMWPNIVSPVQSGTCNNNSPGCDLFKFNKKGGGSNDWATFKLSRSCVVARQGNGKWTDEAPSTAELEKAYLYDVNENNSYVGNNTNNAFRDCSMVSQSDSEVNLFTPLSSDKVELKSRVDKLKISGSTAGHIGTAWSWYALSPKWSYLYPTGRKPGAYNDATVKKIAVLMTDGDYNTEYCKGVESKDSYDGKINCNGDGGTSEKLAEKLCEGMKSSGITVYTVGFQTSTGAAKFLKGCASSNSHYYAASDGDALRLAFRDIALKIASIVVTK